MNVNEVRLRKVFKRLLPLAKSGNPILDALERLAEKQKLDKEVVQKPFAGFENWEACMAEQEGKYDKETAEKVCGRLKAELEGKRASCSCGTMAQTVVKRLLAEGQVLKYKDGSLVTDVAKQGGRAMGKIATPMELLFKVKDEVDKRVAANGNKGVTDVEVSAICKQVIGQIPPGWEGYTIPDWASYEADAKRFLTKMGYASGVGDLTPPLNVIATGSAKTGGNPNQTFEDVWGVDGRGGGEAFAKRGARFGRRLLALKRRLKGEGLLKQEELPPELVEKPLDIMPTNLEDQALNIEERMAAAEDAIDQMSQFLSTLGATAGQQAEAADQAAEGMVGAGAPAGKRAGDQAVAKRGRFLKVDPPSAVRKSGGGNGTDGVPYTTILGSRR